MNLLLVNLSGLALIGLIVWWFWMSKTDSKSKTISRSDSKQES